MELLELVDERVMVVAKQVGKEEARRQNRLQDEDRRLHIVLQGSGERYPDGHETIVWWETGRLGLPSRLVDSVGTCGPCRSFEGVRLCSVSVAKV
jgi:hypothetical protein